MGLDRKSCARSSWKGDGTCDGTAGAQTSTVTGVVSTWDDAYAPVDGATVAVVGTSITTVTDADGMFTLENVPNGEVFFATLAAGNWGTVDFYDVPDETADGIGLLVLPDSEVALLAVALERTIDNSKGLVDITYESAEGDETGGETGAISAPSDDPFTFDLLEFPIVQDTVIADDEGFADLIFTSVDPSDGPITASVTGLLGVTDCLIDQSPGTTYPIIAKSITFVYAICSPAL
jgi:hypothetical protein